MQVPNPEIEKQLQLARQNLLDLSMRNRLIHYRPSKNRTVELLDDSTCDLYEYLVLQGKSLELRPNQSHKPNVSEPSQPEDAGSLTPRYGQTPLDSEALSKQLFQISQQAKTFVQEQGYTVLFLALELLKWQGRPPQNEHYQSPLILIPVELDRSRIGRSYRLSWTGEDIITNISLQARLQEEGIMLPEFAMPESKEGIASYLQQLRTIIYQEEPDWKIEEGVYLDFFSFTKFVMYKDLAPEAWPGNVSPADHPLIQSLFDPLSHPNLGEEFNEQQIDQLLIANNLFHVMDADPSQIGVIEEVKAGKNMVVEGPPGTGKSQTITNIIATAMATGKSVLFVSEKMAALEVVKNRLDQIGLGDFCLELHSRKSRKMDVINELKRTLGLPLPQQVPLEEKFAQLENLKDELNDYARVLREPLTAMGYSPYDLHCLKEAARSHFNKVDRKMPRVRFMQAEKSTPKQWEEAKSLLTSLADSLSLVKPVSEHPWRASQPGVVLPSDEEEIAEQLASCKQSIDLAKQAAEQLREVAGTQEPKNIVELEETIAAAEVMLQGKERERISREVLLSREWGSDTGRPEHLIELVAKAQQQREEILKSFEERVLKKDVPTVLSEYKRLSAKWSRFLSGRYRYLNWEICFWYKSQQTPKTHKTIADLEKVNDYLELVGEIREAEREARRLFDFLWNNEHSNPETLRRFTKWMKSFSHYLSRKVLSLQAVDMISQGFTPQPVEEGIAKAKKSHQTLLKSLGVLEQRVGLEYSRIFNMAQEQIPFSELASQVAKWKDELPGLQPWSQFSAWRESCLQSLAAPVIAMVDSDDLEPEDVLPCFTGNFADELLRYAFAKHPALANFVSELHENKSKRFSELDRDVIQGNRYRLAARLYHNRPKISGGVSPNSPQGILLSEFNRKRGHMPIRALMTQAGKTIQRIKPCFMMSPLSIANFFDPQKVRFDIIIFDEASQVQPEDALGALLRGHQVVVMGDTQQLPPTSFFEHLVEVFEEREQTTASIADMESILHQCKRSFLTKTLRGHYRSRHESLIAVSNRIFYNNELVVYPSPMHNSEHLGLHLIHLPETVYDRGKTTTNRKEAVAVAKAVIDHYRRFPEQSLGIGTFNIKQQQLILEEIDRQLMEVPEVEEIVEKHSSHESLFVKNLETIQGDERDVIFLSMGYGFDEEGKLSLHFGPLNQQGGERRLNVLISRARYKCIVFSNFRANDLKLEEDTAFGVKALKSFLAYAEHRQLEEDLSGEEGQISAFEQAICDLLHSHGYKVDCKVGCGYFRVDLAVVHPEIPEQYCLAIECDGPKYHNNLVCRERERLRTQTLQSLGWKIHRVWFPEWYRHREKAEQNLFRALKRALSDKPTANSTQPIFSPDTMRELTEKDAQNQQNEESGVQEYKKCTSLQSLVSGDLTQQTPRKLIPVVQEIVESEGPIHQEEIARRIRDFWKTKRATPKVNSNIKMAITKAYEQNRIALKDSFAWPKAMVQPPVRRRTGNPAAKIDLICDEEMIEAMKLVLQQEHAMLSRDLIKQAAKELGFKSTSRPITDRFLDLLEQLQEEGEFKQLPNGMIDLVSK